MRPERIADEPLRSVDSAFTELSRHVDAAAAVPRAPDKWSKKEIIGHPIDSAANDHQRFVRAQQAEALAFPGYAQEAWVRIQDHGSRPWPALLEFWRSYNHHLAAIIRGIPLDAREVPCRIGDADPVTLGALVEDHLRHLRHHPAQLGVGQGRPA